MTTETVEIVDKVSGPLSNMASGATAVDRAVANLRDRLGNLGGGAAQQIVSQFEAMRGAASATVLKVQAVDAAERAVTQEIQKQVALEAKIATFDANRVRETHRLSQELERMHKGALEGQGGPNGAWAGEGEGGSLQGLVGMGGGAMGAAAAGIGAVAFIAKEWLSIVKAVVVEFATLTYQGAQLALEMSAFKHEQIEAFSYFTGSRSEAQGLYEDVKKLSNVTGESRETTANRFKKLLGDGFDKSQTKEILGAVSDIGAARGEESGSALQQIIETTKQKGTFDSRALKGLARDGVSTQKVYEQLAKTTHKSIDQVKRDLKAGTIASDDAIKAITKATESQYGGAAARKAESNVGLLFLRIKNDFKDLFEDVDISPVTSTLKNIAEVLEGPEGKALKGAFSEFFGATFEALFGPFKGTEGKDRIVQVVQSITEAVRAMAQIMRDATPAIQGFLKALAQAKQEQADNGGALGKIPGIGGGDDAENPFAKMFVNTVDPGAIANDNDQQGAFEPIGDGMIQGLIDGITAGKSGVVDAIVDTCTSAEAAARATLDVHSPSRVFADLGAMLPAGFAQGIASNDAPSKASADMANGATTAAMGAPSVSGQRTSAPAPVVIHVAPTTIHIVAKDGADVTDAAAQAGASINAAHRDAATAYWRDMREVG